MMLRARWGVVAVLGIALAGTTGPAPAQSAAHKPKTVQPDQGAPPDQAQQPDVSSQIPAGVQEQFPDPPIPDPPTEKPAPVPDPVAETPADAPPPVPAAPEVKAAVTPPTPPAPPAVPANTPEGRRLQTETADLLQLARDLKTELEKAGTNTLSLDALRKLQEIQKMSKSLKEEMSRQETQAK